MNLSKTLAAAAVATLTLTNTAQAEVITIGDLQTDNEYNIIADTVRGREYLRFDTFQMTFAETLASVEAGGEYEGWSIANSDINDDFINAIFGQTDNACTIGSDVAGEYCGSITGWVDGALGASYQQTIDYYGFLNTTGVTEVGITSINGNTVTEYNDWGYAGHLDSNNIETGRAINLLLYRDNSAHLGGFSEQAALNQMAGVAPDAPNASVPLPASGGLLLSALALLGLKRKK